MRGNKAEVLWLGPQGSRDPVVKKENTMIKKNGLILAAFLMASTSPLALAQSATTQTDTVPGASTESGAGAGGSPTGTSSGTTTGTTTGTGAGTDSSTGSSTGTGNGSATGTGSASTTDSASSTSVDGDHRQLITSLSMSASGDQDWSTELGDLSSEAEVEVVTLSELESADDSEMPLLDKAMSDLEGSQDGLRSAIEGNDTLTSALEAENYAVDDVVAAVVEPGTGDKVTLIVDDASSDN